MKKLCTTLVAVLAIVQISYGQFSRSGGHTYLTNIHDSLGIGTSTPQGKLQVYMGTGSDMLVNNNSVDIGLGGITSSWARAFRIVNTSGSNGLDGGAFGVLGSGATPTYVYMSIPTDQPTGYNSTKILALNNSGNVGIGTTSPTAKLQINQLYNAGTSALILNQPYTSWGTLAFFNSYRYFQTNSGATDGNFKAFNIGAGGVSIGYSNTPVYNSGDALYVNGNVGIGTATPKETLSVNGNIRSKQVKVETANWPDYVFQKEYTLPSLSEVKSYIDQNQHLPEMPSETEVARDGINLGEINKLLTKKVEELTLYAIEQQKQIELLKQQQENNKQLNERMIALEKALAKLTANK